MSPTNHSTSPLSHALFYKSNHFSLLTIPFKYYFFPSLSKISKTLFLLKFSMARTKTTSPIPKDDSTPVVRSQPPPQTAADESNSSPLNETPVHTI